MTTPESAPPQDHADPPALAATARKFRTREQADDFLRDKGKPVARPKVPPEARREIRALERIVKQLPNLGAPGRKWLRDVLTEDMERRNDPA